VSKLLNKLLSSGSIKDAFLLSESPYFSEKDIIHTELPILNAALSGSLSGGLVTGLTVVAGPSKSFKTLLGLYMMKAYMTQYPDAVALFYDSEFGTTPEYMKSIGLDTKRIIHMAPEHLEAVKFDIAKRLSKVERGEEKVFILIDSLSNFTTKKEHEDADKENTAKDMQRQQSIRAFLRLLSHHVTVKDLPAVVINHVYQTQEMYSKTIVTGGTAVTYLANQVLVITKAIAKDGDEIVGNDFTITIDKSRFVKEKSKFTFRVVHNKGIEKYSGLWDLAIQAGVVKEVTKGWYSAPGYDKNRRKEIEGDQLLWESLLEDKDLEQYVQDKYKLTFETKHSEISLDGEDIEV